MFQERIWTNTAARQQIAQMLGRKGLLSASRTTFDALDAWPPDLDSESVNFRSVNFGFGDLDDMTAALGNFVFKVAVAGDLERPPGSSSTRVTIRSVGVFIRDSFDFNDFQGRAADDSARGIGDLPPSPAAGHDAGAIERRSWLEMVQLADIVLWEPRSVRIPAVGIWTLPD
jgi:hypothetical protein